MSERRSTRYLIGGGASVLVTVAVMLWAEFYVAGNLAWNIFLGVFLVGLIAAAILLQRFFMTHSAEIGEARFDTVERKH